MSSRQRCSSSIRSHERPVEKLQKYFHERPMRSRNQSATSFVFNEFRRGYAEAKHQNTQAAERAERRREDTQRRALKRSISSPIGPAELKGDHGTIAEYDSKYDSLSGELYRTQLEVATPQQPVRSKQGDARISGQYPPRSSSLYNPMRSSRHPPPIGSVAKANKRGQCTVCRAEEGYSSTWGLCAMHLADSYTAAAEPLATEHPSRRSTYQPQKDSCKYDGMAHATKGVEAHDPDSSQSLHSRPSATELGPSPWRVLKKDGSAEKERPPNPVAVSLNQYSELVSPLSPAFQHQAQRDSTISALHVNQPTGADDDDVWTYATGTTGATRWPTEDMSRREGFGKRKHHRDDTRPARVQSLGSRTKTKLPPRPASSVYSQATSWSRFCR